ncbi:MAG: ABC transporter substrate-binding protein [Chloroflexales bacterium]|nr:ABC transporter substrate-binding protein [Chloroflexales bacterium]
MTYAYRLIMTLFAAVLLLAACGGQPAVPQAPEPTATPAAEAPAAETTDSAAAPAMDAISTDLLCTDGFRFFDHDLLASEPTCIPANPQRVAYLVYPSYLYPFGINPVAAWGLERDAENYPFIADWIRDGTVDHGLFPPNLEVLVEQNPDLILYPDGVAPEVLDELAAIAPFVLYGGDSSNPPTWQDNHRFVGAVFNQVALAEEQIAVYDQRVAELRTALAESLGDLGEITISVVRLAAEGSISLQSPLIASVAIIKEVGFAIPDAIDMSVAEMQETYNIPSGALSISKEEITLADGEVLFVLGSPGGAGAQRAEGNRLISDIMDDPIWQSLRAFEAKAVYGKGDVWMQGNLLTAHLIIDDLAEIFAVEFATPNPFLTESEASAPASDVVYPSIVTGGFNT